ncbi:MAG: M56 family metallopeptidase [Actinomycetota bacterium]
MSGLLAAPLAVLVIAALAISPRLAALRPASATRHGSALLVAVVAPAVPTLWLLGLGGLARIGVKVPAFDWCRHLLPHDHRTGTIIGIAALGWASISTARIVRLISAHRRMRVVGQSRFYVVDSDDLFAYALPGPGGAVVVSSGLRSSLTDDEFDLVLAHEEAHVRQRHDRHLLLALVARAVIPPIAPVSRGVEHHVERWADEEAIRRTGISRLVAARTVAKVALASSAPRPALAFGDTGTGARAEALLAPPFAPARRRHVEAMVLVGSVVVVAMVQLHRTASYVVDLLV